MHIHGTLVCALAHSGTCEGQRLTLGYFPQSPPFFLDTEHLSLPRAYLWALLAVWNLSISNPQHWGHTIYHRTWLFYWDSELRS